MEISDEPPVSASSGKSKRVLGLSGLGCLAIGMISGGLIGYYAFCDADEVVATDDNVGLQSPFRYNCSEVNCTPLDDYVWRDNADYKLNIVDIFDQPNGLRREYQMFVCLNLK